MKNGESITIRRAANGWVISQPHHAGDATPEELYVFSELGTLLKWVQEHFTERAEDAVNAKPRKPKKDRKMPA